MNLTGQLLQLFFPRCSRSGQFETLFQHDPISILQSPHFFCDLSIVTEENSASSTHWLTSYLEPASVQPGCSVKASTRSVSLCFS